MFSKNNLKKYSGKWPLLIESIKLRSSSLPVNNFPVKTEHKLKRLSKGTYCLNVD